MSEHREFENAEYSDIDKAVENTLLKHTWKYWLALSLSGAYVIFGAILFYFQTKYGLGIWAIKEPIYWGLDIPNFIFWIGFSLSGTLLSGILLLTKSHWRNPIYRAAELSTGIALMVGGVVIMTHMGRFWRFWYALPYPNFRLMWLNFRSPLTLDVIGLNCYLISSLIFLYVGSIPDFAALRDRMVGWRKNMYRILSLGWKGSIEQWRNFRRAYLLIACFIIPVAISMHTVTAFVPNMTTNPAVRSTIYPFYFVTGALLSGVSGVIIILIITRKAFKLEKFLKIQYLDNLSKLILVASLLITYIYSIEIFIPLVKHLNFELLPLVSKLRGEYAPLFWSMVFLNSIVPLTLFFRKVRQNLYALLFISIGIEVAMYFERYLMIIPTLSIGYLPSTWVSYAPNWFEISIMIWSLSIFVFIFLLAIKVIPIISIFEIKELMPLPKSSTKNTFKPLKNVFIDPSTFQIKSNTYSIHALFKYIDHAQNCMSKLANSGFINIDIHSPAPNDELDSMFKSHKNKLTLNFKKIFNILKQRNYHVIRFTTLGVILGIGLGLFLGIGSMLLYPIKTGPFEIVPLPPIIFTAGLLGSFGGVIGSAFGMIFLNRLSVKYSSNYIKDSSTDKFALIINYKNKNEKTTIEKILIEHKAISISEGEPILNAK